MMTTDLSRSHLSTDLETLHARVKDKALTLAELKHALEGRGSAMLLILLALLPLPIPFSNSIPAWAVVLLAVGMMEKDGLCVLLGHLTAMGTWVFIGLTSAFAVGGFRWLFDSLPP
jgi:hypothetical protein